MTVRQLKVRHRAKIIYLCILRALVYGPEVYAVRVEKGKYFTYHDSISHEPTQVHEFSRLRSEYMVFGDEFYPKLQKPDICLQFIMCTE